LRTSESRRKVDRGRKINEGKRGHLVKGNNERKGPAFCHVASERGKRRGGFYEIEVIRERKKTGENWAEPTSQKTAAHLLRKSLGRNNARGGRRKNERD